MRTVIAWIGIFFFFFGHTLPTNASGLVLPYWVSSSASETGKSIMQVWGLNLPGSDLSLGWLREPAAGDSGKQKHTGRNSEQHIHPVVSRIEDGWISVQIRDKLRKQHIALYTRPVSSAQHYATTKKKVLCEWIFLGKKFCCDPKKNSYLGGRAEKIAFPPLNYDQKVEFWPFLAFLACCVQHCSHSRASALVQLASLESSDLFYVSGSTRKSPWGPGGMIQEHLL